MDPSALDTAFAAYRALTRWFVLKTTPVFRTSAKAMEARFHEAAFGTQREVSGTPVVPFEKFKKIRRCKSNKTKCLNGAPSPT